MKKHSQSARARRLLAGTLLLTGAAGAGAQGTIIDNNAVAIDPAGIAIGNASYSGGVAAIAFGDTSTASGDQSTAIGAHSRAMQSGATALGDKAQANAADSLALGSNSMASFANSIALGSGSITLFGAQTGYMAFGLSAPQTSLGEVNIGNRTISSLAPGRADQDAVNVAQLKAVSGKLDDSVNALEKRLDGAVMYDRNDDGTINPNSITLQGDPAAGGTQIHNLADGTDPHDAATNGQLGSGSGSGGTVNNVTINTGNALFSAEGSPDTEAASASGPHSIAAGANAQASGNNAVALGASANASADNSVALGQGSVADRANTVSVGAAGQERQIANVAPGVEGTDAVNVNQMNAGVSSAVGQAKSYTDGQVRSARKDSYGGAAAAIAMAGLPQAVLPGHGMIAMSAGTYGGQSAMAIGVSQLSETGKWVYKLQGTASSRGELGGSIGAGMHW